MRDKRPVDELSIEELERILAIRRRGARQERLRHLKDRGRRWPTASPVDADPTLEGDLSPEPHQHEAAEDLDPLEPPVTYDLTDDVPRFEDDLDGDFGARRPGKSHRQAVPAGTARNLVWDRLLLVVEVLALVGLATVLIAGVYFVLDENDKIEALEEETAAIQREAAEMFAITPTPAPELSISLADYVLPGGHYSPQDTGGYGAFNLEELPASVRPAAMAQLTAPQVDLVPSRPNSPIRIVIPAINVDASIYGGDDWFQLQKGVGHHQGSANPGEDANVVLSAHNDIYGEIFRYIGELDPGDEIQVQAQNGLWYTYVVHDPPHQVVKPTDVWVLDRGNQPMVTLITCHPYRVDTQRMVVFADLVGLRGD